MILYPTSSPINDKQKYISLYLLLWYRNKRRIKYTNIYIVLSSILALAGSRQDDAKTVYIPDRITWLTQLLAVKPQHSSKLQYANTNSIAFTAGISQPSKSVT